MCSYQGQVRVRVGGICLQNGKVLLVKLRNFGSMGYFWLPPGGGVHFGESLEEALHREFAEETGLQIQIQQLNCINQVIAPPIHAIEFFFNVKIIAGKLKTGIDPEMAPTDQLIEQVTWLSWEEIKQIPPEGIHNLFHNRQSIYELHSLNLMNMLKR
ncbi:MAG: NUDIX hydrolase [Cytophagales bacterium]|nr:NUDIX hydrolase [Bernardetiaceae bacterium]MDW8210296.1 NUDIX hydrolase [Cytophagales bacterium]